MDDFQSQRQLICDIGRRMYDRHFCAANEGNISIRLNDELVLCTPTLHCKGYMKPSDLCIVDMEGTQLHGERKRTSEVLLHLRIYRERPDVDSVVHCHPPHVTAFAIVGEPIPMSVLPEPEVFLGEVPTAPYVLPGTQEFADSIVPFVSKSSVIVLSNHGVVSYDLGLEKTYWLTEILDSYCRILINSRALGDLRRFTPNEAAELLDLRVRWGFSDPRSEMDLAAEDVGNHAVFRSTWQAAGLNQKAFKVKQL